MLLPAHSAPVAPQERLLRIDEVVKQLSIGRSTVYELIATGALPSVTIGRSRRVPQSAVMRFIEDRMR